MKLLVTRQHWDSNNLKSSCLNNGQQDEKHFREFDVDLDLYLWNIPAGIKLIIQSYYSLVTGHFTPLSNKPCLSTIRAKWGQVKSTNALKKIMWSKLP